MGEDPSIFDLPPIPNEVIELISVGDPICADLDKQVNQTKHDLKQLQKLVEEYSKKMDNNGLDWTMEAELDHSFSIPEVKFAKIQLVKTIRQHKRVSGSIYAQVYSTLALTVYFLERAIALKIPVTVHFDKIKPLVVRLFHHNKDFQKYSSEIRSLQTYINHHQGEVTKTPTTVEMCMKALEDGARNCDFNNTFSYYCQFDKLLMEYLMENEREYLEYVARQMSPFLPEEDPPQLTTEKKQQAQTERTIRAKLSRKKVTLDGMVKRPDLVPLERLFQHLFELFRIDSAEKEVVLKCALIRIIFDVMYTFDHRILMMSNDKIIKTLDTIRQMQVGEMGVPSDSVFEDMTEKICDLKTNNDLVIEINKFMDTLNFCNNPWDIAETICTLATTVEGMRKSTGGALCFDDFFSIFIVVFSAEPPATVWGIDRFFEIFAELEIPETLKHAKASFCAWVSYLESFSKPEE